MKQKLTITCVNTKITDEFSLGQLSFPGVQYFCDVLEPTVLELQPRLQFPRVKRGIYKLEFAMSSKFHEEKLYLLDVPGRSGIMIHSGNTASDTRGCLLLGRYDGGRRVLSSRATVRTFENMVRQHMEHNYEVYIDLQ